MRTVGNPKRFAYTEGIGGEMPKNVMVEYEVQDAPSTPLSLRFDVIYAPRRRGAAGCGIDGVSCAEMRPGQFVVTGWGNGRTIALWEGGELLRAYQMLALALGMVASEAAEDDRR